MSSATLPPDADTWDQLVQQHRTKTVTLEMLDVFRRVMVDKWTEMNDRNIERNARIEALEAELTTVKTELAETRSELAAVKSEPRMKYLGIWRQGHTHEPGDTVSHKNSLWVCAAETSGPPGTDFIGWRMVSRPA